jgi:DNA-binding MarR family transcriptional regulator
MDLGKFLNFGKKNKIKAHTQVLITEIGKKKAEKFESSGKEFAILAYLNEKSPSTITEIAEETDIDIDELKARIELMSKANGTVRLMAVD